MYWLQSLIVFAVVGSNIHWQWTEVTRLCAIEIRFGTDAVSKMLVPSLVSRNVMRNKCSNES